MTAVIKPNTTTLYGGDEQLLFEEIHMLEKNIAQAKLLLPSNKSEKVIEVLQDVKRKLMCFNTPKEVRDQIICLMPLLLITLRKECNS